MQRRGGKRFSRLWRPAIGPLAVLLALADTALAQSATQPEVDLLLVLAVDVSESINRREAWLQRYGHAKALSDPLVLSAVKKGKHGRIAVAYLEWAGPQEQRLVIDWSLVEGRQTAEKVTQALRSEPISGGYWTSMSAALETASRMIASAPYKAPRRVIDLSSDGRNNAGEPMATARKRVLDHGITINGLPVMVMRRNFTWPPIPFLNHYFEDCVIGGPGAFSELVQRYEDFPRVVRRKLIREIAGPASSPGSIIPATSHWRHPKVLCAESDIAPDNRKDRS